MYITDMYRGIIQESQWSGPGTYLRQRIDQYGLDKIVKKGRIWRLTYEGMGRRTEQPKMLTETPAQLVAHLSDANGWWRDTAQQLLVLKQDKSVVPALQKLARSSSDQLARIHALWTLDGLGATDAALVRQLMEDKDAQIRIQAIRASETLYKGGDKTLAADYQAAQHRRRHRRRDAVADDDEHLEGAGRGRRRSSRRRTSNKAKRCAARRARRSSTAAPRRPRRRLHRSGGAVHAGRAGGASTRAARSTRRCASPVTARTATAAACRDRRARR